MIAYYEPDIITAQDYYPFGMLSREALPNSNVPYKFGFNGKMNDNDVKGGFGLQQDYGMRIYDNRVGRFLSVDPLTNDYPWYTPYQFAGNKPIKFIDIDGLEEGGVETRTTPKIEIKIDIDLLNGRSGGRQMPNVPNPPKSLATGTNIYVNLINAGIEAYQAWQYYKEINAYVEKLEKRTYHNLNSPPVQMKTRSQILSSLEYHNNQDPSQLSDHYLAEVEKRINDGTASEQDRLYQNEITRRKLLLTGSSNDASITARNINYKGFSAGELKEHFLKHGHEFGNITQAEYLSQAKGFAAESGENFQEQVVGNFYIKYDRESRRLLVAHTKNREIRTFYKADERSENPFQDAVKLAENLSKPK